VALKFKVRLRGCVGWGEGGKDCNSSMIVGFSFKGYYYTPFKKKVKLHFW
jgi:hypothetical protein